MQVAQQRPQPDDQVRGRPDVGLLAVGQHELAHLHRAQAVQVAVIRRAGLRHEEPRDRQVAAGGGRGQPAFLDQEDAVVGKQSLHRRLG
jgi:hypothetical protein